MSILRGCVKNLRICRLLIILLLFQGSMQKEIRHGHVKKPRYLRNVPISLQRSFKGVKWWTEQPHEGMVFMKAKKKDLIAHFKEQLLKVWNVSGDFVLGGGGCYYRVKFSISSFYYQYVNMY